MYPNIEKSIFRPGQYIGYAMDMLWRITKINSACGKWQATIDDGSRILFARTLKEMSDKLSKLTQEAL